MIERGASDLHKRWARLQPPLRPGPEVIAAVDALLEPCHGPRLLLGVTPELAVGPLPLVALDWSDAMIGAVWPGRAPGRSVVQGDWRDMPFAQRSFASAVGDGSLNMCRWPDDYRAIADALSRVVHPGGRVVIRCFTAPDVPESVEHVIDAALAGRILGFHAFKWRLAMAVAQGNPNLPMVEVWRIFSNSVPDRPHLADAAGWSLDLIGEIDDYASSPFSKSFPTRRQLLDCFDDARLVDCGGYELAERCPLLVIDR